MGRDVKEADWSLRNVLWSRCWTRGSSNVSARVGLNNLRFSIVCAVGGRGNTGKNQGPAGRGRICHL